MAKFGTLDALRRAVTTTPLLLAVAIAEEGGDAPRLDALSPESPGIAAYEDRFRLINFWASWCAPCREEMPDLNELQSGYDPAVFRVIGVAADDRESVLRFLDHVVVQYPIFIGEPDRVFAWSQQLGNSVVVLPFSVILDSSGQVRWSQTGGRIVPETLTETIDELLSEASASHPLKPGR